MSQLKACTACFSTDIKLYNMDSDSLRHEYNLVSGLETADCFGMPKYLCFVCSAYVRRFVTFRQKCQRAHFALRGILLKGEEINASKLEAIDREQLDIMPVLSFKDMDCTKHEEVEFQWTNNDQLALNNDDQVSINHHCTYTTQVIDMPKEPEVTPVAEDYFIKSEFVDVEDVVQEKVLAPSTCYEPEQLDIKHLMLIVKEDNDSDYYDNNENSHSDNCSKDNIPPVEASSKIDTTACIEKFEAENSCLDEERASMVCNEASFNCKKKDAIWDESRPKSLSTKGVKRVKGVVTMPPFSESTKLPLDFPVYSAITHEELYGLIQERKKSREYIQRKFKCEFCYRGFMSATAYNRHMRKHDPEYSGAYQCDMCKLYFRSRLLMYNHMKRTHQFKYSCQLCKFVSFDKFHAHMHYRRHKNKNVLYKCPNCKKQFNTAASRFSHMLMAHASTLICNVCERTFTSRRGLYHHNRQAHRIEVRDSMDHGTILNIKKWTRKEEINLMRLYKEDEHIPWGKVASSIKNRSKIQIYNKYLRLVERRKGRFIPEEDAVILACLDKFGLNFKKMSEYLPGRSATQIRVRYWVLAKTFSTDSTIWTVQEDKRLLQIMSNQDGIFSYSRVTDYLPGKNRIHLQERYETLLTWMKSHPNSPLENAPRRGARCLDHGLMSDNLNKATEILKQIIVRESKAKKITRESPLVVIEDAIIAKLQAERVEEEEKTGKSEVSDADVMQIPYDEFIITAQTSNVKNLQKLIILLRGSLNRDRFKESSYASQYPGLLDSQQKVNHIQIKSYSKKQKSVPVIVNSPDIWGNNTLAHLRPVDSNRRRHSNSSIMPGPPQANEISSLNYVLPPHYATISGCRQLMAYVNLMAKDDALMTSCININIKGMLKKNPILKEQMFILMERFNTLFLYPMLLSNESPERVGKYVLENKSRKDVGSQEKMEIGPGYSSISVGIPRRKLGDSIDDGGSIDLVEPSASQKARTLVRKVLVDGDTFKFISDHGKKRSTKF